MKALVASPTWRRARLQRPAVAPKRHPTRAHHLQSEQDVVDQELTRLFDDDEVGIHGVAQTPLPVQPTPAYWHEDRATLKRPIDAG